MKTYKIFWFFIGLAFLSINTVYGDTLNVPANYLTIQAAVDAASDGDTILVGPGIYHESVDIIDKNNIILQGDGINSTIIDGVNGDQNGTPDALIVAHNSEPDFSIVIDGFSIRNSLWIGVLISSTNYGSDESNINAVISNCEITNSEAWGILMVGDNIGTSYIVNNIISENGISGFRAHDCNGKFSILHNTIVNNNEHGYEDGGNVIADEMDHPTSIIRNNIIASNGEYGIFRHHFSELFIAYNNVWNNGKGSYYEWYQHPTLDNTYFPPTPGTGEISENPDFIGGGDYRLKCTSSCIDAGECTEIETDINGNIRPIGPGCDMGAYEFSGRICPDRILIDLYLIPKWRPIIPNLRSSRRLPITILTTNLIDANDVDPLSIELAGARALKWKMKDVDKDGDKDMLIFFKAKDLDLNEDVTEITLEGKTYSGTQFYGTLPVNVESKGNAYAYGKTGK